jgi:predicted transcriptional regulator
MMETQNTGDLKREMLLKAELAKGLASIKAGRVKDGKQVFTGLYASLKLKD